MPISDYQEFTVNDPDGHAKTVFTRGEGPGVVVLHELPGLTPDDIALGDRLALEGFSVFLPLMFGKPGQDSAIIPAIRLCISREMTFIAEHGSTPTTQWLRAVCREARERTGGPIGVIGLCLTGGLVLALIADDSVTAPVMGEPALPIPLPLLSGKRASRLGVSPEELASAKARVEEADLTILGLRFSNDWICPNARFERLKKEFGAKFNAIVVQSPDNRFGIGKRAHSVLSSEYRDSPHDHPTRLAYLMVVQFLSSRLKPTAVH